MTAEGKRFVAVWAVGLVLLFAVSGYFGVRVVRGDAAATAETQTTRIESPTHPQNVPASDLQAQSGANPVDVRVGVNINRIGEFALKESAWTADFNLWFLWSSDAVMPGETFNLVNGQILQQNIRETSQNGTERYVEYHMVARMRMDFDATRFPFAEEAVHIQVEDATPGAVAVRYVADEQHSALGNAAMPRAATCSSFKVYTSTSDDTSRPGKRGASGGKPVGRSQFTAQMQIVPEGVGIYRRMFQALFASVAVALIALYIKPTHVDCRFGLPVGGFFASVSNNIFVGSLLPFSNAPTLTDVVNAVSLLTIFLILVQSVISLYLFDTMGRERLSRFFDRISFVVFLLGYVVINLTLPFAARPQ